MEGRADLHVHTTASDGTLAPWEVVRRAAARGLAAVAITDHDSVAGIPAAREAAVTLPLEVVPGIELGCEYRGEEVHILGYFPDLEAAELQRTLVRLARDRRERMEEMLDRCRQLGLVLPEEKAQALSQGIPTRAHLARALVEMGYAASASEAFHLYLDRGRPAYVPRDHLSPPEAVRLLRRAGGCPVLAHPGLLQDDSFLPSLVEAGLVGIEVYYPEHDLAVTQKYLALAKRWGLLATGGSDCHGEPERLGKATAPYEVVEDLYRVHIGLIG